MFVIIVVVAAGLPCPQQRGWRDFLESVDLGFRDRDVWVFGLNDILR
jgi:hypothetical protein